MAPAGRPKGPPHATRSLRLPVALWEAIEAAAERCSVTANAKAREWLETMAGAAQSEIGEKRVERAKRGTK